MTELLTSNVLTPPRLPASSGAAAPRQASGAAGASFAAQLERTQAATAEAGGANRHDADDDPARVTNGAAPASESAAAAAAAGSADPAGTAGVAGAADGEKPNDALTEFLAQLLPPPAAPVASAPIALRGLPTAPATAQTTAQATAQATAQTTAQATAPATVPPAVPTAGPLADAALASAAAPADAAAVTARDAPAAGSASTTTRAVRDPAAHRTRSTGELPATTAAAAESAAGAASAADDLGRSTPAGPGAAEDEADSETLTHARTEPRGDGLVAMSAGATNPSTSGTALTSALPGGASGPAGLAAAGTPASTAASTALNSAVNSTANSPVSSTMNAAMARPAVSPSNQLPRAAETLVAPVTDRTPGPAGSESLDDGAGEGGARRARIEGAGNTLNNAGPAGPPAWLREPPLEKVSQDAGVPAPSATAAAAPEVAPPVANLTPPLPAVAPSVGFTDPRAGVQVELATPVASPQFADALGVQVSVLARGGVEHAELHLNPAAMGPLSVQITLDGAQAQVHFGTDSAQTRQIVEAGLPALAAALRDAGLTLSGGGVSQHNGGQRQSASRGGSSFALRIDPVMDEELRPLRAVRAGPGRLDTYA